MRSHKNRQNQENLVEAKQGKDAGKNLMTVSRLKTTQMEAVDVCV